MSKISTGTRVPYAEWEDLIIINEVKNYPTNLRFAFREAAKKLLKRSLSSIEFRWYSFLRCKADVNAMTTGSNQGFTQNVKNLHVDKETGILPEQNLKHYLYIVKEMLELPTAERNAIIALFAIN